MQNSSRSVRGSSEQLSSALRALEIRPSEPSEALRMVALWYLAPLTMAVKPRLSVKDMADFIGAEGYGLEDHEGERTLVPEETCS